jgi:cbb3-type cytochrome oxidase cytochrome c subunit
MDAVREQAGICDDDCVPADAVSAYDYARHYGIARQAAADQLNHMVELGLMRTGKKLVRRGDGRLKRWVRYYWPA